MASTRYSESRTLARGFRRLEGESREQFKANVLRLRRQFEQFNVDVSELCQWLMTFRPDGKHGSEATKTFWEFFLEPEKFLGGVTDENESDRQRRMVLDVTTGLAEQTSISNIAQVIGVEDAIREVIKLLLTETARKLCRRLGKLGPSRRQILAKAAAEWVVARYVRCHKNWERQSAEWEKEKNEWENEHLELTESVRQEFNEIFKSLGIRIKKPRVCLWERLKNRKNNCQYAGERIPSGGAWKNHGSLCVKYKRFKDSKMRGDISKYFTENAKAYLELRRESRAGKEHAMNKLLQKQPKARWFPQVWEEYLKALEIKEETVLAAVHKLPHCVNFGAAAECEYNNHTNECENYRKVLEGRPELQELEGLYRLWRSKYLSRPSKPAFQYPSRQKLPTPKIFGAGFFRVDFEKSVLELCLGDKAGEDVVRFGFRAWPKDYEPQPERANITSVHISFVGTRARAGFHFEVQHERSRFSVSQDEIDELRSRKYPRQAQDQKFLDEARGLLLRSFKGDGERELRLLTVDLGTGGGSAAVLKGRDLEKAEPLKVVKIERLYQTRPKQNKKWKDKQSAEDKKEDKKKGLSKDHVGRHLEGWASGAKNIAERRGPDTSAIREHDMRRLSLHVRWMIRDWVRLNASQIIEAAERNKVDLIVFESMRGFTAPGYDKLDEDKKRRLGFFAYGQIRRKVAEKAVERGMRVITVPYLKSSQYCAECGKEQEDKNTWGKNKRRSVFRCEKCRNEANSDVNAARVLGRVFWGEIKLPEKLPERA